MARLWNAGFESGAFDEISTSATAGTATSAVDTATVRSGLYSAKFTTTVGTYLRRVYLTSGTNTTVVYARAFIRISTAPDATIGVMHFLTSGNAIVAGILLTSASKLQLIGADGAQIGADSAALSVNTWYRVELKADCSTNPDSLDARLNGSSFASGNSSGNIAWQRFQFGMITTNSTGVLYFDDLAVNDGTGTNNTSWCGDGKIVAMNPNLAGDANTFLKYGGGAGDADNYALVNEIPPVTTNSYVNGSALNAEDMYNVSQPLNIRNLETINCVTVGGYKGNVGTADATTAIKWQIKKASGGTVLQSAAVIPNSTSVAYRDSPGAASTLTNVIAGVDPDGAAWTLATLKTTQIGAKITAFGTYGIAMSKIYANVEYVPRASLIKSVGDVFLGDLTKVAGKSDTGAAGGIKVIAGVTNT